jgi:hypothetical protein
MPIDITGNEYLHREESEHFVPSAESTSLIRDVATQLLLNLRINSQVTPMPVGEDPPAAICEVPMP